MDKDVRVIWITGLSGSGKTTLAKALQERLPNSILLDGDGLREVLGRSSSGFDSDSRRKLAFSYARLARLLANQGFIVIVATISLFHDIHAWNRANLPGYVEVFLDIPEEVRKARDPKGLYAAEERGVVTKMAGNAVKVEIPINPHIVLSHEHSLADSVKTICAWPEIGK